MRQSLTSLPALSLYDGQTLIGTISIVKERFVARDAARRLLGRFKSQKAALAAINCALASYCAGQTNARRDGIR
jgi:hypothetical protein